jgi:hypothetical protein
MLLNRVFLDRQEGRLKGNYDASRLHVMPAEVVEQVESVIYEVERANAALHDGGPVDAKETQRQMHGNDIYLPAVIHPIIVTPNHSDPFIVTFIQSNIVTSLRANQ